MTSTLSSILIFGLVLGTSIATIETVQAQTNGMERRQDCRDTRQDCRSEGGLMGSDKRDCKQDKRSGDDKPAETTPVPATPPAAQ